MNFSKSLEKKNLAINLVKKKDNHILLSYTVLHRLLFFLDWVFANIPVYICYSSLIITLNARVLTGWLQLKKNH